jgi:ribose transport system permease protein
VFWNFGINNGMNMLAIPYFDRLTVRELVIVIAVSLDARSKSMST